MSTRYVADHLLTMAAEPEVVGPGVVDVDRGRVVWSGPAADAPPAAEQPQRLEGLLIPGLISTHAHTPMVLLRGAGEGLPVSRWLTEVMWPREGRLTPEDVYWGMTLGAAELLANGVTTTHEMYFFPDAVAEAAAAAGLRAAVTPPLLVADDLSRFGGWEEQLEQMVEQAHRWAGHDLISIGFGPHSGYALPEEPLVRVAELALAERMTVHIHVAEQRDEGEGIMERFGLTIPAYLDRIGLLQAPVVAAHGVWLTPADIELFALRQTGVAHCPCSNAKHASGIAPVRALRAASVPVGLGTDGPASHDRLDLFEEMRWAVRLARLDAADAGVMGPLDALTMATAEGARVLGRSDLGRLVPGSRADMVLLEAAALVPTISEADLLTHLVYLGSRSLVKQVWVEGRQVVENGCVTTVDIVRARAESDHRARRLAGG